MTLPDDISRCKKAVYLPVCVGCERRDKGEKELLSYFNFEPISNSECEHKIDKRVPYR